ncbi:MAG: flagellar assembly protein FliH [Gammaproteobacteria bacterium SHHR-1]
MSDPGKGSSKGFQAWLPPDVGDSKRPRPLAVNLKQEKLKMPTAEDIEAIRQSAQEEGYAEGFAKGQAEGQTEGHEEGYQKGQREGLEEARQDMQRRLTRLDELAADLEAPLDQLDEEVEESLISLALAVARQLIRREIRTDPAQIVGVVREALGALPANSRKVRIHLHPDDARLVEEAYQQMGSEHEWRIEQDPSLSPGGCLVTSQTSRIDASLERRFASVIAPLLNEERHAEQMQAFAAEPEWLEEDRQASQAHAETETETEAEAEAEAEAEFEPESEAESGSESESKAEFEPEAGSETGSEAGFETASEPQPDPDAPEIRDSGKAEAEAEGAERDEADKSHGQ